MRFRLILAIAMVFSVVVAAGAAASEARAPEDHLTPVGWDACPFAAGFDCGTVRVPIDHDNPAGSQIGIAMARLPATDQHNKIGSIFLNPGGPGGSGVNFLLSAGPFLFTDEVRAHFDLVGFDPRGTNRSRPLQCFESYEAAIAAFPPFAFPMTSEEEAIEKGLTEYIAGNCASGTTRIKDYMSTADVARDIDLMRQMVGDEQLNFAGYSYGSILGNYYINLFPDNVRAVVIDGVVDPYAWATGVGDEAETLPVFNRVGGAIGAQATIDEFFRLCDEAGTDVCAFAPDSAARYQALVDLLLAGPIMIVNPFTGETIPFTYADLIGISLAPLYQSASWPAQAELLALIEAGASAATIGNALAASIEASGITTSRFASPYPTDLEGLYGVLCSDTDNPDTYEAWPIAAAISEANDGYFGRLWTHVSAPCWNWPGVAENRYVGPFEAATSNTVLVVTTTYDPATPIHGAIAVNGQLPDSAMLTVEGWGHTSLFLSACADSAISAYFLTTLAPPDGTVCTQDFGPFDALPAGEAEAAAAAERTEARRSVMNEIALRPGR